MELYQILCVKKIAEYQNMSKAAAALNITQPSLSRTLKSVEDELHTTLFDRSGKKLTLNHNGELFCQYAKKILFLYDKMVEDLTPVQEPEILSLNIAMLHSNQILPNLIAEFSRQHEHININLQRFSSLSEVPDTCDFLIFASNRPLDTAIHADRLFDEECKFGMSIQHPLASRPFLTVEELSRENFLSLNSQNSLGVILSDFFETQEISPNVLLHCDSQVTVSALVAQNVGLALFPTITWNAENEPVVLKSVEGLRLMRTIYLEQRNSDKNTAAVLFKKFVRSKFRHETTAK